MRIFVIVFTIVLITSRSMLMKAASDKENSLPQMLIIFLTAAISSAAVSIASGFTLHRSTIIIAILFGIGNFFSQYLNIKAMGMGMASQVVFVCSCNFLISSVYSVIVFGEHLTLFRILGIILVLVSQVYFYMGSKKNGSGVKAEGNRWLLFAVLSMVCSGIVGIVQKYMGRSAFSNELPEMSMIAACVSSIIAVSFLSIGAKWNGIKQIVSKRKILYFSLSLGICATVINVVSTYAGSLVDGSLAFPVFNGGSLILSMLASRFLFNDRLSRKQKYSIAVGLAAIAVIGL